MVTAPDFKEDIFKTSLSLAAGYFSKKIAIGSTKNPLKLMLGNLLQMGVTNAVSKNADGIKTKFVEMINVYRK